MPSISTGQTAYLTLNTNESIFVTSTGSAAIVYEQEQLSAPRSVTSSDGELRIGPFSEPASFSINAVTGSVNYQSTPTVIQALTPTSSPVDVAQTVNGLIDIARSGGATPLQFGAESGAPFTQMADVIDYAVANSAEIVIPTGFNLVVPSTISIPSNVSLNVRNGASITAASSFSGTSLIRVINGSGASPAQNVKITGEGRLDAANNCDIVVDFVYARFSLIDIFIVSGGAERGIVVGSDTSKQSTNVNVNVPYTYFHESQSVGGTPKNSSTSIGIEYRGCSDSLAIATSVIGYRCGYKIADGSVTLIRPHAWTRAACGPMSVCFDITGSSCVLVSPDADTPTSLGDPSITEVVGYKISGFNTKLFAPRIYLNSTLGRDDECVGFDCTIPNPQSTINSPFSIAGSSRKLKLLIRGFSGNYSIVSPEDDGNYNGGPWGTIIGSKDLDVSNHANFSTVTASSVTATSFVKATGTLEVSNTGSTNIEQMFKRGSSLRFTSRVTNTTESGSNAGSNWQLVAYSDAGSFLYTPLQVTRSNGLVTIGDSTATTTVNIRYNGLTETTVGAAGAASALPSAPTGYLSINIGGTVRKIPFYNA